MRCTNLSFPKRLNELRLALGFSQTEFAEKLGITQAAMSQLLSGKRDPAVSTLMRLKYETGVSLDHLFSSEVKK